MQIKIIKHLLSFIPLLILCLSGIAQNCNLENNQIDDDSKEDILKKMTSHLSFIEDYSGQYGMGNISIQGPASNIPPFNYWTNLDVDGTIINLQLDVILLSLNIQQYYGCLWGEPNQVTDVKGLKASLVKVSPFEWGNIAFGVLMPNYHPFNGVTVIFEIAPDGSSINPFAKRNPLTIFGQDVNMPFVNELVRKRILRAPYIGLLRDLGASVKWAKFLDGLKLIAGVDAVLAFDIYRHPVEGWYVRVVTNWGAALATSVGPWTGGYGFIREGRTVQFTLDQLEYLFDFEFSQEVHETLRNYSNPFNTELEKAFYDGIEEGRIKMTRNSVQIEGGISTHYRFNKNEGRWIPLKYDPETLTHYVEYMNEIPADFQVEDGPDTNIPGPAIWFGQQQLGGNVIFQGGMAINNLPLDTDDYEVNGMYVDNHGFYGQQVALITDTDEDDPQTDYDHDSDILSKLFMAAWATDNNDHMAYMDYSSYFGIGNTPVINTSIKSKLSATDLGKIMLEADAYLKQKAFAERDAILRADNEGYNLSLYTALKQMGEIAPWALWDLDVYGLYGWNTKSEVGYFMSNPSWKIHLQEKEEDNSLAFYRSHPQNGIGNWNFGSLNNSFSFDLITDTDINIDDDIQNTNNYLNDVYFPLVDNEVKERMNQYLLESANGNPKSLYTVQKAASVVQSARWLKNIDGKLPPVINQLKNSGSLGLSIMDELFDYETNFYRTDYQNELLSNFEAGFRVDEFENWELRVPYQYNGSQRAMPIKELRDIDGLVDMTQSDNIESGEALLPVKMALGLRKFQNPFAKLSLPDLSPEILNLTSSDYAGSEFFIDILKDDKLLYNLSVADDIWKINIGINNFGNKDAAVYWELKFKNIQTGEIFNVTDSQKEFEKQLFQPLYPIESTDLLNYIPESSWKERTLIIDKSEFPEDLTSGHYLAVLKCYAGDKWAEEPTIRNSAFDKFELWYDNNESNLLFYISDGSSEGLDYKTIHPKEGPGIYLEKTYFAGEPVKIQNQLFNTNSQSFAAAHSIEISNVSVNSGNTLNLYTPHSYILEETSGTNIEETAQVADVQFRFDFLLKSNDYLIELIVEHPDWATDIYSRNFSVPTGYFGKFSRTLTYKDFDINSGNFKVTAVLSKSDLNSSDNIDYLEIYFENELVSKIDEFEGTHTFTVSPPSIPVDPESILTPSPSKIVIGPGVDVSNGANFNVKPVENKTFIDYLDNRSTLTNNQLVKTLERSKSQEEIIQNSNNYDRVRTNQGFIQQQKAPEPEETHLMAFAIKKPIGLKPIDTTFNRSSGTSMPTKVGIIQLIPDKTSSSKKQPVYLPIESTVSPAENDENARGRFEAHIVLENEDKYLLNELGQININPNPVLDKANLFLHLEKYGVFKVDLYNAQNGISTNLFTALELSKGENRVTLNLTGIKAGIYAVTISSLDGSFSRSIKIMKR